MYITKTKTKNKTKKKTKKKTRLLLDLNFETFTECTNSFTVQIHEKTNGQLLLDVRICYIMLTY